MTALTYLDFDLQIDEVGDASYRAAVLTSPAGQAEAVFDLPFSALEIENFFLRTGRPRQGVRRVNSPEMNEARKFGGRLYEAVFQGNLHACLLRSIDYAEQREQGIRLRLRLPPSLMELPWEYLYDPARERFLVHSTITPVVRYLDLPQSPKPLTVALPLKVLVVIASPQDYQPLDVEAEWRKIHTAVASLEAQGLLQLTRLPLENQQGATLAALQKQLRSGQFHIFHFVGHGGFDTQTQRACCYSKPTMGAAVWSAATISARCCTITNRCGWRSSTPATAPAPRKAIPLPAWRSNWCARASPQSSPCRTRSPTTRPSDLPMNSTMR
ncbi:MAG: hypothetical protein BroJett021_23770 [Chloroflexota bacterium]|nr:MAG: hypothetical protein BroJett021_23770 [Chloroflexota bacterium]